jgi:hypothetical protein
LNRRITKHKDKVFENIQSKEKEKRMSKKESLWELWDSIKRANIWDIGFQEGLEKIKGVYSKG